MRETSRLACFATGRWPDASRCGRAARSTRPSRGRSRTTRGPGIRPPPPAAGDREGAPSARRESEGETRPPFRRHWGQAGRDPVVTAPTWGAGTGRTLRRPCVASAPRSTDVHAQHELEQPGRRHIGHVDADHGVQERDRPAPSVVAQDLEDGGRAVRPRPQDANLRRGRTAHARDAAVPRERAAPRERRDCPPARDLDVPAVRRPARSNARPAPPTAPSRSRSARGRAPSRRGRRKRP